MDASARRPPLAEIFWNAVPASSEERTPVSVVRHALACIHAFNSGEVLDEADGEPISLMELLADIGMKEDLVYASPELVRGETLDERSLVFTIGVLIFERLTDRHPFGTTEAGRLARLRRGEMGSGVNYFPSVPQQLRAVLMKAMGPFPEERYRGLAAMRADLARFAGDPSLEHGRAKPSFFDAPTKVGPPPTRREESAPNKSFFEASTEISAAPQFDISHPEIDVSSEVSGEIVVPERPSEPPPARAFSNQPVAGETPRHGEAPSGGPSRHAEAAVNGDSPVTAEAGVETSLVPDDDQLTEPWTRPPPAAPTQPPPVPAAPQRDRSTVKREAGPSGAAQRRLPRGASVPVPVPVADVSEDEGQAPRPVVHRGSRATQRVEPIGRTARLLPLIYVAFGALLATVMFLLFGGRSTPPAPVRATVPPATERAATKAARAPQQRPRAAPMPVIDHDARRQTAQRPRETSAAGTKTGREPSPASAKARRAAPAPQAVPRAVASRALEAGRRVMTAIRGCGLPHNDRSFRLSVYAQANGRVVRAFVSRPSWMTRSIVRCIRSALAGKQLPFSLPQPGFVEWTFRVHTDGNYVFRLIRPTVLD